MKTRCPHCSKVQTVYDGMANAQITCEECHGKFTASPLPKLAELPTTDDIPRFRHFGPGWWLTCLAILAILIAVVMTWHYGWPAGLPFVYAAAVIFTFAQIINYLGHISKQVEYGLTRKPGDRESGI
jgi:hypothetical protein